MARGSIGFWVNRKPTSVGGYGLLYNWYAIGSGATGIANVGWHVSTADDCRAIQQLTGENFNGHYLFENYQYVNSIMSVAIKDSTIGGWSIDNGNNSFKFNGMASKVRTQYGVYFAQIDFDMWTSSLSESRPYPLLLLMHDNNDLYMGALYKEIGASIRLVKDSTTLIHGQSGTYTGNDGTVYPTICIGTQEWLAINLKETKYQNGDTIPEVTDDAAWEALTTGALCAYDNDWSNV